MKTILALALFCLSAQAHAVIYSCQTEFGETVVIRKVVLKTGQRCESCKQPAAPIGEALIDRAHSRDWNVYIERDTTITSKIKRRVFEADGRQIFVDTRYAKQRGRNFQFEMNCHDKDPKTPGECSGKFLKTDRADFVAIEPAGPLFDRRPGSGPGRVEITLGRREHLGFIARVFKTAVPIKEGGSLAVSSSGELKFFREEPLYILDAGADEQLHLIGTRHERIAALEIKITCKRD